MAANRRRRVDAELIFEGQAVSHDLLVQLWNNGTQTKTGAHWASRFRVNTARGLRLKTMTVELAETWKRRHPEAAAWVVKVLPERRTLERDLIANVASVEPTYSRVAVPSGTSGGLLDRDKDYAESLENYMETWRQEYVPYQTFAEKATEDGEFAVAVIPTDVDMEGCPDFYDRLDQLAYEALEDDERAGYEQDEDDPKGRYVKRAPDGAMRENPAYDRDKEGKPRGASSDDFDRDDEKSKEAHKRAVQRYLLKQEQGAVTVRVIPANDCVPYLTRGTKREPWKLFALVERTLYHPEELLQKGYGWRGMGDRALIPKGFDATRSSGQNGMFYLYTLYTVWADPEDPKKIARPIICYSVGGHPTWTGDEPDDQKLPESGVAVIDLYETHGLEGPFWWYGGGLHTSDDDPDYYWEPYLWPLTETILGIEGMGTSINGATVVQAFTGYYHKPDAAVLSELRELDDEGILDADGELRRPEIPAAGEIVTSVGEIIPAQQATVSRDAHLVIERELLSLQANTALEQPGVGSQSSGHAMVIKETIAQTAKRHIREGALDAVRFCGERALRIFHAIEREYDVQWPLQTIRERPVGSTVTEASEALVWDSKWVGDGEYRLKTAYPAEYNPVKVEVAMAAADRGYGSPEEVWDAMGVTDHNTQWTKILKWGIRRSPAYMEARALQVAKQSGDKLMLKVLKLQAEQKMTKQGPPGMEQGVPTAMLQGPDEAGGGGGVAGGPTSAQRSLGGQMASQTAPEMRDAAAVAQLPGGA